MSSTRSASDFTSANLGNDVTSALGAADGTATQRIETLSLVHQARATRLARIAASVTTQYGAESPQAISAKQAVTDAKTTAARVEIVRQQAATPTPQVPTSGWALQGRVFDAQLQPVSAHTVYLVDAQNTYQSTFGFAYTDASGYFAITFAGEAAPTPVPRAAGRKRPAAGASAAAPSSELFVAIVSPAGQPVYLGTTAFEPILGAATYQNIVLSAGESPIGDPPEVIRRIAVPPTDPSAN